MLHYFFVTQSDPNLIPTFPFDVLYHIDNPLVKENMIQIPVNYSNGKSLILTNPTTLEYSEFIGFDKLGDYWQWHKAINRALVDFIPLLPANSDLKTGIIDYVIKILGGVVTFGLIFIALRRRFERKYYH